MNALDALKVSALVFAGAILQASVFSDVVILDGTPDLLLVVLVSIALLRGPLVGAGAGFAAGLLLDTATLETLGVTSLLLTLAGYWIGRYGETTGRDRAHAPFLSVAVITYLYLLGSLVFHYVLGEPVPAGRVLLETAFQTIALNLILTWPVYRLTRWLLASAERGSRERMSVVG